MKATPAFKQTIRDYLEKRGSNDPLFARIVTKPGKNMDDCITCILNTVQRSGCNGFTDDEVYSMAIHYFDEDNIDIGKPMNCQVVVNYRIELTDEEKTEARKKAMNELTNEIKAKARKKYEPTKVEEKDKPVEKSLF
jgi:hypothetical protein